MSCPRPLYHMASCRPMAIVALLLLTATHRGTAGLQVAIHPQHMHLVTMNEGLTVLCVADAPLTHCQIRVADRHQVDLSMGANSTVSGYHYEGDGLPAGHCAATINSAVLPRWGLFSVVQCRVRSVGSDWAYATMSVYRNSYVKLPTTTKTRLVVVHPGGEVKQYYQAFTPLIGCRLIHPQQKTFQDLLVLPTCGTQPDSVCYYGRGMKQGQCGAIIRNISNRSNGLLWFQVDTARGLDLDHLIVIVTKPPNAPVLMANTTVNADGTTTVEAVCTVTGSRPASTITWVLDGEDVTSGVVEVVVDDRWVFQYEEQTTAQRLTKTLDAAADGKELWCTAHHVALPAATSSNKIMMEVANSHRSDPCLSSPCDPGVRCRVSDGEALCECFPGSYTIAGPEGCRLECVVPLDCPTDKACVYTKCVDPCVAACGLGASCQTIDHRAVCSCPQSQECSEMPAASSINTTALGVPATADTGCSAEAQEEHRVKLLHMEELQQIQKRAELARAQVEEGNALEAKAKAQNAEEELEFQRQLRRNRLLQVAGNRVDEEVLATTVKPSED